MRWVVGDRAITGSAASASQMGRFETKWLSRPENLAALADLPERWIDTVHQRRPPTIVVLDIDSSESPLYPLGLGRSLVLPSLVAFRGSFYAFRRSLNRHSPDSRWLWGAGWPFGRLGQR
jgi:hypothetical protein